MEISKPNLIRLVETVYQVALVSVLFWILLLKRGMIYAWIQGIEGVHAIFSKKEFSDLVFRKLWRSKYDTIPFELTLSFLLSLSFLTGMSSWFLWLTKESSLLALVFLFSSLVWMVLMMISTAYVYHQGESGQERLYHSLLFLGQHSAIWCPLLLILGLGLWLALTKNWLIWFLFPGFYFLIFDRYFRWSQRRSA